MPQQDESQEDSLFALDGFDEEQAYGDHAHVPDIGGDAFPQSDDDDSSTNGKFIFDLCYTQNSISQAGCWWLA